jgi:hypothetical protein
VAGHDLRVLELVELRDEAASRGRIEARAGLVHDQDVGAHGQHRGDGHGALLASGEPVRRPGPQVRRPDPPERGLDARPYLPGRQPQVGRAEAHVVLDGGHEELIVRILEHHPQRAPHPRQGGGRDRPVAHPHRAALGEEDAGQVEQQGGLPCAVSAHQAQRLAVVEGEGDPAERGRPVGVPEVQILHRDQVVAHGKPFHGA